MILQTVMDCRVLVHLPGGGRQDENICVVGVAMGETRGYTEVREYGNYKLLYEPLLI